MTARQTDRFLLARRKARLRLRLRRQRWLGVLRLWLGIWRLRQRHVRVLCRRPQHTSALPHTQRMCSIDTATHRPVRASRPTAPTGCGNSSRAATAPGARRRRFALAARAAWGPPDWAAGAASSPPGSSLVHQRQRSSEQPAASPAARSNPTASPCRSLLCRLPCHSPRVTHTARRRRTRRRRRTHALRRCRSCESVTTSRRTAILAGGGFSCRVLYWSAVVTSD